MMTSIGRFFWLEYHRSPVDWLWLATLLFVGIGLTIIGLWREYRHPNSAESLAGRITDSLSIYPIPNPDPYVGLFSPLQIEAFQLAKELNILQNRLSVLHPDQKIDSNETEWRMAFAEAWRPYEKELPKVQAEYSHSLATRVKDIVLRLRIAGCRTDQWIDRWFNQAPNDHYLGPLRDVIVAMAHELDGMNLSVANKP